MPAHGRRNILRQRDILWGFPHSQRIFILLAVSDLQLGELAFLLLLGRSRSELLSAGELACWPEDQGHSRASSSGDLWEPSSIGGPTDCFRDDAKSESLRLNLPSILPQVDEKVYLCALGKRFTINFLFSSASPSRRPSIR